MQSYWLADASFVTLLVMLVAAVFVLPVTMEVSSLINLRLLLRDESVNAYRIVGAVSVYLLLALMGALTLEIIHAVTGVSIGGNVVLKGTDDDYAQFIYFSLASLTTVGFGDIYAVSTSAKMLATFLSTLGVLFPAIVFAGLVGLASSRNGSPSVPRFPLRYKSRLGRMPRLSTGRSPVLPNLACARNGRARRHPVPVAVAFLALAAVALLSSCNRATEAPQPEVRPVRVITIEKRAGGDSIALTGSVQAQTEINLSFRIDGRMLARTVNVGDTVRPGQLIARLDPQNEASSLQAAQAQLVAARARLAEARNNFTRFRDLVAESAVSRASFEQAESAMKGAESQVETAQSQVTLGENRLSYTRLVSDVAGVVTAQGAEPGEVVGAGRMIVQVAREAMRDAVFDVPARVKDAAPANPTITVILTSDPKVTTTGTVREVAPRADPVTGTFRVRVRLNNPPPAMRLGATVTGRMQVASAPSIEVPPSAVIRSDRQAAVWVVDSKTGLVAARNIQIRSSDPVRVEVASGLNPGDVVVTAGVQALRAGQKVRLLESKQ